MLPGTEPQHFVTRQQLGPCAWLAPEDIDPLGRVDLATATTVTAAHYRLLLSMVGTWQLTLPTGLPTGFRATVSNAGTGVITLGVSSGNVAGRPTVAMYPGETFDVVYDGTNWRCPGRQAVVLLSQTVVASSTAQIDLTRGFTDDPEITGMRIDYNGISASSGGATLILIGLNPSALNSDYVMIGGAIGSSAVAATGVSGSTANIGTASTTAGNSSRGVLNVDISPTGTALVTGQYVLPGSSMTFRSVAAHFGLALTGLRILPSSGTISAARIMQYGFRGA